MIPISHTNCHYYYYSNRDENISTDVFDPSWDSLVYFDFLCLCNIVEDTVVKEYILIVSEDTKSLFA